MSRISNDFTSLKYNLYELLNVQPDADPVKIKKNFMKVIKNFHPDKNSDLEEEIYYHIVLANKILLDKESRKQYDEYINDKAESFEELKSSFAKSIKDIEHLFPAKETSTHAFNAKIEELNKKHGYNDSPDSVSVMDRFNKIKEKRDVDQVKIDKENFKDMDEFNNKFASNKSEGGKFQDQLVEYNGVPQELSTYVVGEQYTSLVDLDKLYVEDSVQGSKFSSLDRAFMLQPVSQSNVSTKSAEERMNEYKNQTEQYKNYRPSDFSTKKFNDWE